MIDDVFAEVRADRDGGAERQGLPDADQRGAALLRYPHAQARSGLAGKKFGAAPAQRFGRGEELGLQVEHGLGPLRQELDAALSSDVGKALGNIGAAGEDDAFDPGADRRLGGAGIVAAIEERD